MKFEFIDTLTEPEQKFIKIYSSEPPIKALTFKISSDDGGKTVRPNYLMSDIGDYLKVKPFRLSIEDGDSPIIEFVFNKDGRYLFWNGVQGSEQSTSHRQIRTLFHAAFLNAPIHPLGCGKIYAAIVLAEQACINQGLIACQGGTGRDLWFQTSHTESAPWPIDLSIINTASKETPMKTAVLTSQLNYYVKTRDGIQKPMVPGQMMRSLDPVVGLQEFDIVIQDDCGKGIVSLTFGQSGYYIYWFSPDNVHQPILAVFRQAFTMAPVAECLKVQDIYAALILAEVECTEQGLVANHNGTGHTGHVGTYCPHPRWKDWQGLYSPVNATLTPPFADHGSVPPRKGNGGAMALFWRDQLSRIIGEISDSATDGDITKEVDGFIQDNNKRYSDWENAGKLVKKLQDDEWHKIGEIEADLEICRALLREREADLNKRESVMSDKLNEATGNAILFSHIISIIAGKLDRIAPSGIGKMDYTPRSIVTGATVDRDQSLRSMALIEEQLGKAKWWKRAGVSAFAMGIAACIYSFAVYPTISAWINSQ